MIKAVFIDIDDTLTTENREVSKENREEIIRCQNKGIHIVIASGRTRQVAMEYQEVLKSSPVIISSNGASVYDIKNEIEVYNEVVPKEVLLNLFDYAIKGNFRIQLNYSNKLALSRANYPDEEENVVAIEEIKQIMLNEKVVQCVLGNSDFNKMLELKKYLADNFQNIKIANQSKRMIDHTLEPKKSYYCDIVSINVSKGSAVRKVCEYFNLKADEIVTIGDGENDISMFELTPNSVAMGNASDFVKSKANSITLSNEEDGVAKVLEKL